MNCPYCDGSSRVIDSRPIPDGVRRRRECDDCRRRFTTYERSGPPEIRVVKAGDPRGEGFDREKLAATVMRVSKGLPVTAADADRIGREIEAELLDHGRAVVPSGELARALLARLEKLHRRAALRFQANYLDADGNLDFDTHRGEPDSQQRTLFEPPEGGSRAAPTAEPEPRSG